MRVSWAGTARDSEGKSMNFRNRRLLSTAGVSALAASTIAAGLIGFGMAPASANNDQKGTATPIKHVVVIFGENVSFDHYFATYPQAANIPGETQQGTGAAAPAFTAAKNTPKNIATLAHDNLLAPNNPNAVQPQRLTPSQAITCDQDHEYTAEQKAYNGGLMNKFVENTSMDTCSGGQFGRPGLTTD
jgi:phospholipase C